MISTARLSTTDNPFIVYDFYEQLEMIVQQKKLKLAQLWNCGIVTSRAFPLTQENAKWSVLEEMLRTS